MRILSKQDIVPGKHRECEDEWGRGFAPQEAWSLEKNLRDNTSVSTDRQGKVSVLKDRVRERLVRVYEIREGTVVSEAWRREE